MANQNESINLRYAHVTTMHFLEPENRPKAFMEGLLLTKSSTAVLIKNGLLRPEKLITVQSEHYYGQRILGTTFNLFGNNSLKIFEFIENNKQFNRMEYNLACWEVHAANLIEEILKLAQ